MHQKFTPAIIEALGYYVYILSDPRDGRIFYIGKGIGNRIFAHINDALADIQTSDKLDTIRAIHAAGLQVEHSIHRHGLTEKEAFEVEAALIDLLRPDGLTNIVAGHHSSWRGPMSIDEIFMAYDAPVLTITEPVLLIIINRLFERGISDEELYAVTRGNWVIGERRAKAQYAMTVYHGLVRQVYRIDAWEPAEAGDLAQKTRQRWRFSGVVADELQNYVGGSVVQYLGASAQNPIRYVNC